MLKVMAHGRTWESNKLKRGEIPPALLLRMEHLIVGDQTQVRSWGTAQQQDELLQFSPLFLLQR
jgi:hypothetical protein